MKSKTEILRSIYLFLVSLIGVTLIIFGLISISTSLIDVIFKKPDYVYKLSKLLNSGFSVLIGLFVFGFHWSIIKREGRLSSSDNRALQSDENFWGNLFFYSVSFIGLMIMIFSFISIGSAILKVNYSAMPPKSISPSNKLTPKEVARVYTDIEAALKSSISFVIGLFSWLLPWTAIKKIRKVDLENESRRTGK